MQTSKKILILFCPSLLLFLWGCNRSEPTISQQKQESTPAPLSKTEQPIVQILGQPYIDDPELPEWLNDCERGWHELPAKAEAGDPEAQNKLAHMYYDNYNLDCASGPDDKHDPRKALDLFLKSAEQGNVNSMFMAGLMYLEGPSFYDYPEQDSKEAEKWFLKAVAKGDTSSALELSRIYAQGLGMPKDPQKARKWAYWALKQNPNNTSPNYYLGLLALDEKQYKQAAKFFLNCTGEKTKEYEWMTYECRHAGYQLSTLYEQGLGVEKDLKKAAELYDEARSRAVSRPILTPDEDITTIALDRLWYIAVYKKNPQAQYELGRRYETGDGVEKDEVRAAEWYSRAAEQNNPDALYALAMIDIGNHKGYHHYCIIDWIPEKRDMLEKAAELGHAKAAYELGQMYKTGAYISGNEATNGCLGWGWRYSDVVIGRDESKARYYFKKSGINPPAEE